MNTEQMNLHAFDTQKNAFRVTSFAPSSSFPEIKKTISANNTPEQLIEASTPCTSLALQANKDNAGTVYIGPLTVDSDSYALEPGNSISISVDNANLIYLYGTLDDKVVALYNTESW